jgi:sugar/nucleoside kinase (ribokinase family)
LKNSNELIKVTAFPVNCIDTTGAGDLYAAGFLFGMAKGLNLERCGIIGSLMAGKVIEIVGARMNREKFREIKMEIDQIIAEK